MLRSLPLLLGLVLVVSGCAAPSSPSDSPAEDLEVPSGLEAVTILVKGME